ncbi:MAG: hypothetical protein M1814_006457 [Vezdaea aestivalis]|nr:MAG: hypothetical protein M1814_006457 [Vezdaea aestivalis]
MLGLKDNINPAAGRVVAVGGKKGQKLWGCPRSSWRSAPKLNTSLGDVTSIDSNHVDAIESWFFFYNFGLFAWGGPVAQIALIKDRLVLQDGWITLERFQRVFSVYQILPGPEAAELCMFFGCLSAGRTGGIVAGIAFILPGFIFMLVASYLYTLAGLTNEYFNASFKAVQPVVAALILRAIHKITEHSIVNQNSKKVDPFLVIAAICTFLNCALRINIFISLAFYGVVYTLITLRLRLVALVLFILQYAGYAIFVVFRGVPSPVSLGLGIAPSPTFIHLFVLGLVAGSLSFGGAYTAIPFIQVEAVLKGAWLAQNIFLDGIAIGNMLPAPLVIFATFVGFQGGLVGGNLGKAFAGAVVITIGMFSPCFVFTIAGHEVLEKLILKSSISGSKNYLKEDKTREAIRQAVQSGPAVAICLLALGTLYKFNNKWTPLVLIIIKNRIFLYLFQPELIGICRAEPMVLEDPNPRELQEELTLENDDKYGSHSAPKSTSVQDSRPEWSKVPRKLGEKVLTDSEWTAMNEHQYHALRQTMTGSVLGLTLGVIQCYRKRKIFKAPLGKSTSSSSNMGFLGSKRPAATASARMPQFGAHAVIGFTLGTVVGLMVATPIANARLLADPRLKQVVKDLEELGKAALQKRRAAKGQDMTGVSVPTSTAETQAVDDWSKGEDDASPVWDSIESQPQDSSVQTLGSREKKVGKEKRNRRRKKQEYHDDETGRSKAQDDFDALLDKERRGPSSNET